MVAEVISMPSSETPSALQPVRTVPPSYLSDRVLEFWRAFSVADRQYSEPAEQAAFSGGGQLRLDENHVESGFSGREGSYQLRFRLPNRENCNGVSARFRLRGWNELRYAAIGYTHKAAFRHVKIANPAQDMWVDVSTGHGDLAWGWQNDWEHPPATEIDDIRLYIKGRPGEAGAYIDVEEVACWREQSEKPETFFSRPTETVAFGLQTVLHDYLKKCFRDYDSQAHAFLERGQCPFYGDVNLDWAAAKPFPDNLERTSTYKFSWHALHPATILMIYARTSGEIAPLFAAREFVTNWLDRSYYQPDPDKKYAWYDHGTAERCLAMIMMWAHGVEQRFDRRFMERLRDAIFRHAQLLASETFYASHQPARYHNHAWFQDLALLTVALAFPYWPCARMWADIALMRLSDQFEKLIVRDGSYAIFVENSIGYHHGVQRIAEFAGNLVMLSRRTSDIPATARELMKWSDFLRYPDNRAPARGDTFRRPNPEGDDIRRVKPFAAPACTILSKAGYAVAKGNHEATPFMFTMFATSLSPTHKHEDSLSFTLFFDGLEWLIDPSFYSHEYGEPIPAYFRSASAHNALVIPNCAYSIAPGLATLRGEARETGFQIFGEHRAYEGAIVTRIVKGRLDKLELAFTDTVHGEKPIPTPPRLMLHCGEKVKARAEGRRLVLTHPDSRFQIVCELPSENIRILNGQSDADPIRGIAGHGFMQTVNVETVECETGQGELSWILSAE